MFFRTMLREKLLNYRKWQTENRKRERDTEQPVPFSLTVKAQLTKSDSCQLLDNWGQLEEK